MPKRIVDGEALWTSTKLRRVSPPEFRFHYANWLPLAEANGVFEADFDVIWSKIYAPLSPDLCTETVRKIFEEFVRVGLVAPFEDAGKVYGYFTGIDKPGRLPSEAHRARYKTLPPDYPGQSGTGIMPEGFGIGLVLDRLGIGEEDMSLKNALTDKSREILGVRITNDDRNWPEVKALARVYGEDTVVDKFEVWAKTLTQVPNYPLSGFVRVADALLAGKKLAGVSPEVGSLINELAVISDNRVIFNNNQKAVLSELLQTHLPADIKSAFAEFWGNIENDDFAVRQAAKTFVEAAEQLLYVQARRREKEAQTRAMLEQCTENERKKAEEEMLARQKAEEDEQNLIEDTL